MISGHQITESDIYKACIVLSVIGLSIIHISQSYMTAEKVNIEEIDETWLGKTVKINGTIKPEFKTENAAFYTVKDSTGSIDLADFENQSIPRQGRVTGYVDVYQGDLQVIVKNTSKTR